MPQSNLFYILCMLIFSLSIPNSVWASTITVTTVIDEDDSLLGGGTGISLREACSYSSEMDTILLASGTYTLSLNEEIVIGHSIALLGLESGVYIEAAESPGTSGERIFNVLSSVLELTIKDLVLRNGYLFMPGERGAAVLLARAEGSNSGLIYFENVEFSENQSLNSQGGAVYILGVGGNVKFENCQFIGNKTGSSSFSNAYGGALYNKSASVLEVNRCNFESNLCEGKNAGAGAFYSSVDSGITKITYSSFIYNEAVFDEFAKGGAIYLGQGNHLISDCTFTENLGSKGGAICDDEESNTVTIIHSTIVGNICTISGGGIDFTNDDGASNLINSIVAKNTIILTEQDINFTSGTLTTNEHNNVKIEVNASVANTYLLTGDPLVADVEYFENIVVRPLLSNSPARDTGISILDGFEILSFDVQGTARAGHDLGANEFGHTLIAVTTDVDEDDGFLGGGNGVSIREAINYSLGGDTIYIPLGVYHLSSELSVDKGLVILGENPDTLHVNSETTKYWEETIIQSSTSKWSPIHRIFNVNSPDFGFYLKNITLRNAKNNGSSILMNGDSGQTLGLDYVHLIDNVGNTAIVINGNIDSFKISNSVFRNNYSLNYSNDNGGVIKDNLSGFLEIENCIFQSNDSNDAGGAINRSGDSKITNTSFIKNELDDSEGQVSKGGAIYYGEGDHIIANCTFMDNYAIRGGGIFDGTINNTVVMSNCTFFDNHSYLDGEALATTTTGDNFQIINTLIIDDGDNNSVIANYQSDPIITNSIISDENIHLDESWSYGDKGIYLGILEGSNALEGGISDLEDYFIPMEDQLGYPRSETPDIGAIEKSYSCSAESIIFQYKQPTIEEIYTADYAVTDANNWTHYCNAGGNIMLSLDTTGTGAVVLPSNVTLRTSLFLVREDDLPVPGSLLDFIYGGLYSEWMWNVEPETQPEDSIRVRSYVHLDLYQEFMKDAPNFIFPSTITSIEDLNAYVSNNSTPFTAPNESDVDGYEIISDKTATNQTFISGEQGAGYFMEYFVPVLNTGGVFTNGNILRNRWTGVEDEDWHNTINWSEASIPTENDNVTVPANVPHDPVVGDSLEARCKSIKLQCFSKLTLGNAAILNIENE